MKIIYLDSTRPDLEWYRLYCEAIFLSGANRAATHYLKALANLTDNPRIGQVVADDGTRRYSNRKTPFAIFFRVSSEYIEIVRLWDQRADPEGLELHEEAAAYT